MRWIWRASYTWWCPAALWLWAWNRRKGGLSANKEAMGYSALCRPWAAMSLEMRHSCCLDPMEKSSKGKWSNTPDVCCYGDPRRLWPPERDSDCNEGFKSVKQLLKYLIDISCSTERQFYRLVYSMAFTLKMTCIRIMALAAALFWESGTCDLTSLCPISLLLK